MRAVICLGGNIADYSLIRPLIQADDKIICADSGYLHAEAMGLSPDAVVGDFDSINIEEVSCDYVFVYPQKKDYTDGELAVEYAMTNGCDDIVLIGALGGRIDHELGNIALLKKIMQAGKSGRIISGNETVWLVDRKLSIAGRKGDLLSIIAVDGNPVITTSNLQYPLHKQTLSYYCMGISNVFEKDIAGIEVENGSVLAIHTGL